MYYAVVFHRFNGMLSCCKDLADYASILHWRNAASHRYTFGESINLFIDLILKQARIGTDNNDEDSIELPEINQPSGAFAPSPLGQVTAVDQSNDDKEVDMAKVMPFATIKSNTTPGQGKDVHLPDAWFAERAACDGVYWAKRLKRPESGVSRPELAICHVCKRETSWYCFGCNRYLCNIPPQPQLSVKATTKKKVANVGGIVVASCKKVAEKAKKKTTKKNSGEDNNSSNKNNKKKASKKKTGDKGDSGEKGQKKKNKKQLAKEKSDERKKTKKLKSDLLKKYPKRFTTKVPVTTKDGALVTDGEYGAPTFEERYGEYTCSLGMLEGVLS
jgi:hypothetical protein